MSGVQQGQRAGVHWTDDQAAQEGRQDAQARKQHDRGHAGPMEKRPDLWSVQIRTRRHGVSER